MAVRYREMTPFEATVLRMKKGVVVLHQDTVNVELLIRQHDADGGGMQMHVATLAAAASVAVKTLADSMRGVLGNAEESEDPEADV